MRFSIWPSNQRSWSETLELAQHAERTGWDGLWVSDHLMGMEHQPAVDVLEAWTSLAAVAARTDALRIGTLVTGVGYRNPMLIAKMAVTVDQISRGRLTLGLGAGWQRNEHDGIGLPLQSIAERAARLEATCFVVRSLLDGIATTLRGQHVAVVDAVARPRPIQPRVPLLLGGEHPRHVLPVVARHADLWNTWSSPGRWGEASRALDRACEAAHRDPASVERSTQALVYLGDDKEALEAAARAGPPLPALLGTSAELRDALAHYARAGLDELIVPDFTMGGLDETRDTLDRFLTEVAAPFRDQLERAR